MSLAIIPIDPAYMMLFGVLFGMAALRNRSRGLAGGLIATSLFGVGVPLYCYVRFPDWMWGYLLDPATVPVWAVAAIFLGYYVFFALGFALVPRRRPWIAFVGVGLLNLAALAAVRNRYGKVGTFDEFHRGVAADLMTSPLQTVLNIGFVVTVAGTVALLWWASRRPAAASVETTPGPRPSLAAKQ